MEELTLEAKAEAAHNAALVTGLSIDYQKAADLYRACGKMRLAAVCQMTADAMKDLEEKDPQ